MKPNPSKKVMNIGTKREGNVYNALVIYSVVIHPKKPVIVTASDDCTWRMWGLPAGDLIMTGDGHKDWVAGLDFHPRY